MEYTAPDGIVIRSSYLEPVTYFCNIGGIEGTFTSYETQSSSTSPLGIEQIKIVRERTKDSTFITITESSQEELQAYLDQIEIDNQASLGLPNNGELIINT